MKPSLTNLLALPAADLDEEFFETLLNRPGVRVERIISTGQATPEGEWYDQSWDEWLLLLTGEALLVLAEGGEHRLLPGDTLLLPAHCRHRVDWTSTDEPTIWLALHCGE